MTISDGQQPDKELVIRLPIHHGDQEKEDDICVLATSVEDPDDKDDWEVLCKHGIMKTKKDFIVVD
jgi:hypothetical protein